MNVITQFSAARDYALDLRFQAMFAGAAIGIALCHLDGRVQEANPALTTMLGYSPEELTGTSINQLNPEVDVHLSSDNRLPFEPWLDELMRGDRGSFEIENRYQRKDGSPLWGHLTLSRGRNSRRQPAFLIAVLQDATERRRVEEHLHQAEKMEVIGRLAGGIAHDFNNLLTGILLYCDLLSAALPKDELQKNELQKDESVIDELKKDGKNPTPQTRELRHHIEEVRMAGEQGAAMTRQLLSIARKQAAEPRPVRLNEIVASTENFLRRLIGEQIELVILPNDVLNDVRDDVLDDVQNDVPDDCSAAGLVLADPAQLRQILLNLVLNARDALPSQGGKITVITRSTELPSAGPDAPEPVATGLNAQVALNANPRTARHAISLAVQDNGCGMSPETCARLFEPFFTTKNPGAGTGLGLATVQRIVAEAGGLIKVHSELGQGTRIEIFLPEVLPSEFSPAANLSPHLSKNSVTEGGSG